MFNQSLHARPTTSWRVLKRCLLLFWAELERQVRINGSVTRVSREESAAYFHSRPFTRQRFFLS